MASGRRTKRPTIGEDIYATHTKLRTANAASRPQRRPVSSAPTRKQSQQSRRPTGKRDLPVIKPPRGFGAFPFVMVVLGALFLGIFSVGGVQAVIGSVTSDPSEAVSGPVRPVEFGYSF